MNLRKLIASLAFTALQVVTYAQNASIAVNNYTGAAMVNIPLQTLKRGAVTVPVSLVYTGSGIKVKDVEDETGLGWRLIAGGGVYRQLRGLPDDVKANIQGDQRLGWLHNNNGIKINNFSIANNGSLSCQAETQDYSFITNNFNDLSDTEPDIFIVNAPGLSCKLIFDQDHHLHTIPYQDLKISYQLEDSSPGSPFGGRIISFTITNTDGLTYYFATLEKTNRTAVTSNVSNVNYFKREFRQYQTAVDYTSAWKLTQITDINKNSIGFTYTEAQTQTSNTRVALTSGTGAVSYPFTYQVWTKQQIPRRIFVDDDFFEPADMAAEDNNATNPTLGGDRSILFKYSGGSKPHLQSLTGAGQNVSFVYQGNLLTAINMPSDTKISMNYYGGVNGEPVTFPDSTSKSVDLWGYYNGSSANSLLPALYINPSNPVLERYRVNQPGSSNSSYAYSIFGPTREVNTAAITAGSLKTITYSHGGTKTFIYEPNDYYDPTASAVVKGGGIRIKQIVSHDDISSANDMIENYAYVNPSTGTSSGKPVTLPVLAFTTPYSGSGSDETKWINSTVRLEESLTGEDNTIVYSHVKVAKPGAGSTLYEYTTPATFWDNTSAPDWVPTTVNVARPDCNAALTLASNQKCTYPFVPNTNFEFERGLLTKTTQFNDNNQKVSESSYQYERTGAPSIVTGFKFEENNGILSYAKYQMFAGTGKQLQQVNNTTYDLPLLTNSKSNSVNYFYSSNYHKLPTRQESTNSDGSIIKSYTKYLKDFTTAATGDSVNLAMNELKNAGVNIPIETYTQVERNNAVKTVAASLTQLKPFSVNNGVAPLNLPWRRLQINNTAGITNFQVSDVAAGQFSYDPRYTVKENSLLYSPTGFLLTKDDNKHRIKTSIVDEFMNAPVLDMSNARANEIAFNNFDTDNLTITFQRATYDRPLSTDSRSGRYALNLASSNFLTRTGIAKNPLATNYIFSAWIKTSTLGSVTLTLSNPSGGAYTYNLPYVANSTAWKYYELSVPVNNLSSGFTSKVQTSTDVLMDDILLYPEQAEVNTIAYDPSTRLKTAETNTNGRSKYYSYDALQRLKYVYDQDKNIVLKRSYISKAESSTFNPPAIAPTNTANPFFYNHYYPIRFADSLASYSANQGFEGLTYTWNFGDGTPAQVSTSHTGDVNHLFQNPGTYTVTLTKQAPSVGSFTDTRTITISPVPVKLFISSTIPYGNAAITNVTLSQGSNVVYNINRDQATSGMGYDIAPGVYTAKVTVSGRAYEASFPAGYRSIKVFLKGVSDQDTLCLNGVPNVNEYTFTVNVQRKVEAKFYLDTEACVLTEVQ